MTYINILLTISIYYLENRSLLSVNEMITTGDMLWSFNTFSHLILQGNVWGKLESWENLYVEFEVLG